MWLYETFFFQLPCSLRIFHWNYFFLLMHLAIFSWWYLVELILASFLFLFNLIKFSIVSEKIVKAIREKRKRKSSLCTEKETPCTLYSHTIVLRASDLDTNTISMFHFYILLEREVITSQCVYATVNIFSTFLCSSLSTYIFIHTLFNSFFSGENFNINIRHMKWKNFFLLLNLNVCF